jgi:hypothetical protein
MKITVNGVVFENPKDLQIVFDVDPEGETLGGIQVCIKGGPLTVRGRQEGMRIDTDRTLTISGVHHGMYINCLANEHAVYIEGITDEVFDARQNGMPIQSLSAGWKALGT